MILKHCKANYIIIIRVICMQKSRKSRKIKKAQTLKQPLEKNYDEKNEQFQKYFNSISKLIFPLTKIANLKNPQKYQLLFQQKKQQLKRPSLPENDKRILFIDIDQTLLHSKLKSKGQEQNTNSRLHRIQYPKSESDIFINCLFRPFAFQFLRKIGQLYTIYLFTASQSFYAEQIMCKINKETQNSVLGYFARQYCIQVSPNLFVKDPRIFSNIIETEYFIIDNHIASFYPTLSHGIPVSSFYGAQQDQQLKNLTDFLIFLSIRQDITLILEQRFFLKAIDQVVRKRQQQASQTISTVSSSASLQSNCSQKSVP